MQTRRILIGALAAPALLLSACGGDDSVADPPVSSAPTSSTPTNPPPQESAEHFIRRFYALERDMENSGQTRDYVQMTQKCRSCSSLTEQVTRFYRDGGFVRWRGFRITNIRANGTGENGKTFAVTGIAAPTTFKASADASAQHLAGGKTSDLITLSKSGNSWLVTSFAKLGD